MGPLPDEAEYLLVTWLRHLSEVTKFLTREMLCIGNILRFYIAL